MHSLSGLLVQLLSRYTVWFIYLPLISEKALPELTSKQGRPQCYLGAGSLQQPR